MPRIAISICATLMQSAHRSVGFLLTTCNRGAVLKNRIVSIGFVSCLFFCHATVMRAQFPATALTPEAPVLPMDIKFHHVPQYFEQSFTDDPRYARIEALVDEERCDIILLDKTTNREALYSNLKRRVDALAADGIDAHATPVDFAASSTGDSHPLFRFHFYDQFGQELTWRFVPGEMMPHASSDVIFYTHSGVTLLYAPRRAAAAAGTILTIAGREYPPESTRSHGALAAFYATDMTISAILPGTDLWSVESSPDDIVQAAKWTLSGSGGQRRILAIKQLSDAEAAIDQIDPNNPDVPQVVLNVVRANGTYGVSSLSLETHGNRLWIFFGPALPLPARQIDKTTVTFTVAENEQANVASGELEVERTTDAEHLFWRFDTPNSARGTMFITGVNLIPIPREQAKCVDEDCSNVR
jgi:hypothetical protein